MSEPPKGKQAEQGDDTKERPAKGPQRAISLDQFPLGIQFFLLLGLDLLDNPVNGGGR